MPLLEELRLGGSFEEVNISPNLPDLRVLSIASPLNRLDLSPSWQNLESLTLSVPLFIGADIEEEVLEIALLEVDQIFAAGGIRVRFEIAPTNAVHDPTVTVALLPKPANFVV